jgi:hypothetical protein
MKKDRVGRREFLQRAAIGTASITLGPKLSWARRSGTKDIPRRPNLVFILADQWRGQATGYAGDTNARTPNLDKLAAGSVNFSNAVSGCPVCCPYRASTVFF